GGRNSWRFRKALGEAIGQLGAADHRQLLDLIHELVSDQDSRVTAVAGSALGETLTRDSTFQKQGLELLGEWIEDPRPMLWWAAARAIWRAYYAVVDSMDGGTDVAARRETPIKKELLRLLERIARDPAPFSPATSRLAFDLVRATEQNRRAHEARKLELMHRWRDVTRHEVVYALRMVSR